MTDRSSIFASLDRFIEQFASDLERKNGHRSATGNGPVSNHNPLGEKGVGHPGHCGHAKRETCFESDHDAGSRTCRPMMAPERLSLVEPYLRVSRLSNPLCIKGLRLGTWRTPVSTVSNRRQHEAFQETRRPRAAAGIIRSPLLAIVLGRIRDGGATSSRSALRIENSTASVRVPRPSGSPGTTASSNGTGGTRGGHRETYAPAVAGPL
jgi:hypothetical protein